MLIYLDMSIENIRFRVATNEDQSFIDDMNVVAGCGPYMHESELLDTQDYLQVYPEYVGYSQDFGRTGDMGLIADDLDGRPIGAAWARDYRRTKKDAYLEAHPFEIMIAIRESARGRGVGRQLLDSFAVMAWLQGRDELCLSVHKKNPARRLYMAAGYLPILDKNGNEARMEKKYIPMVRELDLGPPVLRAETLEADGVSSRARKV
jgi:GNAT superfamily N-acetyltransferase